MKFVIDENVPLLVATALQSLGHDCLVVALIDPRALDDDIMAQARREEPSWSPLTAISAG